MKKIKTEHKGRICKHHGCKAVLSIYNHEVFCNLHKDEVTEGNKLKVSRV